MVLAGCPSGSDSSDDEDDNSPEQPETGGVTWTAVEDTTMAPSTTTSIWDIAYGTVNGVNYFVAVGSYPNNGNVNDRSPWGAYSTDGGVTWTRITDSVFNSTFGGVYCANSIAYGNGTFKAISTKGDAASCTDPSGTWTHLSNDTGSTNYGGIAYGNGKFVTGDIYYTSFNKDVRSIAYGGGKFVAVGDDGKAAWSTDGSNWTAINLGSRGRPFYRSEYPNQPWDIYDVAYGDGKFVVVGGSCAYCSDSDLAAENWIEVDLNSEEGKPLYNAWSGTRATITTVAYGGGVFVAGNWYGNAAYCSDPAGTWIRVKDTKLHFVKAIAYGDGRFVATDSYYKMAYWAP
ncbi:MAG: hypothetical protein MdMp014T_0402 [Treponematales bacterium]